ncbi:MAG: gamma-glutamylcyclotransferase [bacterium]
MSLTREQLNADWVADVSARIRKQGFEPLSDEQRKVTLAKALDCVGPAGDVWLFGYGSLMWNPIIRFEEQRAGLLYGYRRRFCFWVEAGRGSPEMPGLMLGLDRGGACRGMAFRIASRRVKAELKLVWMREMLSGVYFPRWVPIRTGKGTITALTFVVDRNHRQYDGSITAAVAARHLARAKGRLGSGRGYLENTVAHLADLGFADSYLTRLHRLVEAETGD